MLDCTINKFGCRFPLFYTFSGKKAKCICQKVFLKYLVISRDKKYVKIRILLLFCILLLLLSGFSQLLDIVDGSHWTTCRYIWWGHVNQHSCAPCRSPWLTERNGHFRVVINFILKQACKIIWINCSLFVYIWLQRQHQVASSNAEIYTTGI